MRDRGVKHGNNDRRAPWRVFVTRAGRVPPLAKFYGAYPTQAQAKAVATDRNADPEFAQGGAYRYSVEKRVAASAKKNPAKRKA